MLRANALRLRSSNKLSRRYSHTEPATPIPTTPLPACSVLNQPPYYAAQRHRPRKAAGFHFRTLPSSVTDFGSEAGKAFLARAMAVGAAESFFIMAGQYQAQSEPAFCGITVLCLALNALAVDPGRTWRAPWRWYTEDMLDCCTPLDDIRRRGITLDEFVSLAQCKGASATLHRPDPQYASEEAFRASIKSATSSREAVLVVAFSRKALGQTGDGHFAPVAAYSPEDDAVLLLDVARFKYPPHWVSISYLYAAMQPHDSTTGRSRGWSVLTAAAPDSALSCYVPSEEV